jgi:hypothetical protein
MGKYLDILRANDRGYDINDINDKRAGCCVKQTPFGRLSRFCRTFEALESRCPDHVPVDRWQEAVEDGRRFLGRWGDQAEALGWTTRDLFGLAPVPDEPHPSYQRLSRYDEIGLIWLLHGRPVLALTERTATIESPTGTVTIYRRHNKPALGPLVWCGRNREAPGRWSG